jgi:hypothetical protein
MIAVSISGFDAVDGLPPESMYSIGEAEKEGTMALVATIGLDIAKTVFQVHGVDAAGQVVARRRLTRGRVLAFFEKLAPCLVGIEACSTSHYWARELIALGHDVRLLPAQYVRPYVKRGKNDAADAEAICEAVTAICSRQVARAAKRDDASPGAFDAQPTVHAAFQFRPLSSF